MEHPRTTSARDHDDRAIIDAAEDAPGGAGRAGGNLARDIATRAELNAIDDPDGREAVQKRHATRHGERVEVPRTGDA
ncbi:hypothetical protein COC42_00310 [Sphingomonas spermidinifaciens]|uniref:Uncharacterized protein n=1 Tax=Sphingomonas spermidinifaciens TaxID=1141889 RepID=A0A2A4B5A5_9SPHN|nr:hypothetical protein [Sphingomonas spermidinifaciens]PCD02928.1 hypothetical protein COC42_00310 [Sphingomonas spermidinifaciens]